MKLKKFNSFYPLDKVTIREVIQDILDEYECEVILNEYRYASRYEINDLQMQFVPNGSGNSISKGIRLDLYWSHHKPKEFGQEIMDEIINKLKDCDYVLDDRLCYQYGKFKCEYDCLGKTSATLTICDK